MNMLINDKKRDNWLLTGFLFLYPLDPLLLYVGLPRSASIVLAMLILFSAFLSARIAADRILVAILCFYAAISWLYVDTNYPGSFELALQITYYTIVAIVIYDISARCDIPKVLLKVFFIVSIVLFCTFLIQSGEGAGRVGMHPGGNPSHFAAYIVAMILTSFYLIGRDELSRFQRLAIIVTSSVLFIMLLATQGFNALLGLLASALLFCLYLPVYNLLTRRVFRPRFFLISLLSLGILIYAILNFETVLDFLNGLGYRTRKFDTILSSDEVQFVTITSGRSTLFYDYLAAIGRYGFGNGLTSSNVLMGHGMSAHNQYVTLLFEQGLLGFIGVITLLLYLGYFALKARDRTILSLTLCVFIMMFGNDFLYYKYGWFFIFLLMIFMAERREQVR